MAGSLQSHHLCVFHCHISQTPRQLQKRQINSRNAFSTLGNSIFGRVPFFIILKYHNEILCHHPNTSWSSPVNTTPPPSSESTDSLLSISADVHGVIVRSMKSVDHKKDHHKHHLGFHTKTTWKWYAWIHVHVMSPHVTDIMFRQQVQLSQEKYVSIFCSDGSQKVTSATGQKLSLFGPYETWLALPISVSLLFHILEKLQVTQSIFGFSKISTIEKFQHKWFPTYIFDQLAQRIWMAIKKKPSSFFYPIYLSVNLFPNTQKLRITTE